RCMCGVANQCHATTMPAGKRREVEDVGTKQRLRVVQQRLHRRYEVGEIGAQAIERGRDTRIAAAGGRNPGSEPVATPLVDAYGPEAQAARAAPHLEEHVAHLSVEPVLGDPAPARLPRIPKARRPE